jgi:hypothetical protein
MAGMLEAKSALVTGGGGGIVKAAALAFSREGANVAVADLVPEAAEETVAIVNRAGGQAMSLTGDITDASLVQDMRYFRCRHRVAVDRSSTPVPSSALSGWRTGPATLPPSMAIRPLLHVGLSFMICTTDTAFPTYTNTSHQNRQGTHLLQRPA